MKSQYFNVIDYASRIGSIIGTSSFLASAIYVGHVLLKEPNKPAEGYLQHFIIGSALIMISSMITWTVCSLKKVNKEIDEPGMRSKNRRLENRFEETYPENQDM